MDGLEFPPTPLVILLFPIKLVGSFFTILNGSLPRYELRTLFLLRVTLFLYSYTFLNKKRLFLN